MKLWRPSQEVEVHFVEHTESVRSYSARLLSWATSLTAVICCLEGFGQVLRVSVGLPLRQLWQLGEL